MTGFKVQAQEDVLALVGAAQCAHEYALRAAVANQVQVRWCSTCGSIKVGDADWVVPLWSKPL